MLSPMTTVLVLAILWLVVVVPMLFRRRDEGQRERSVARFGRAMLALGTRVPVATVSGTDVFVPGRKSAAPVAAAARRPVPAPEEALMYPVDRAEMSAARTQMMSRRRRSLGTLVVGAVLFSILAISMGGVMWLLDMPFVLGVVGYVWFLRTQARRDRERRENRQQRATTRRTTGYDAMSDAERFPQAPESVVRIDDDDIDLHNLDTVDLTGLYSEESAAEPAVQRRAS